MAQYATLKAAIDAVIKANGQREITGTVLNQTLNAMVNSLGANYQFAGLATPSTNPGTPDQNVFYLAFQAGTYTNFNATVLSAGISILMWNGSWSSQTFYTIDATPTASSSNLVLSGGVFDAIKTDGSAYDVSAHNEGATFASLSALLNSENLNTLIPVEVRHGGMSIKFVQSSDNNYVQCRLMARIFTTDTAQWQVVTSEIKAGSKNIAESGGVNDRIVDDIDNFKCTLNAQVSSSLQTVSNIVTKKVADTYYVQLLGGTATFTSQSASLFSIEDVNGAFHLIKKFAEGWYKVTLETADASVGSQITLVLRPNVVATAGTVIIRVYYGLSSEILSSNEWIETYKDLDSAPSFESEKLVKSNGIYKSINVFQDLSPTEHLANYLHKNQVIGQAPVYGTGAGGTDKYGPFLDKKEISFDIVAVGEYGFAIVDSNDKVVEYTSSDQYSEQTTIDWTVPSGYYLLLSTSKRRNVKVKTLDINGVYNEIQELDENIDNINDTIFHSEIKDYSINGVLTDNTYINPSGFDVSLNGWCYKRYAIEPNFIGHQIAITGKSTGDNVLGRWNYSDNTVQVITTSQSATVYTDYLLTIPDNVSSIDVLSNSGRQNKAVAKQVLVTEETFKRIGVSYNFFKDKTIWWCGTSIPAGGSTAYPTIVGQLLNASVINKAVGGSMCRANVRTGDYNGAMYENITSALCMTKAEAESFITNYATIQPTLLDGPSTMTDSYKTRIRTGSFEDRLLPYLNGTYPMPDLFVIDHGHNDFKYKLPDSSSDIGLEPTRENITSGLLAEDTYMTANNNEKLESFFGSLANIEASKKDAFICSLNRNCYKGAINFLVTLILKYNPRARIVFVSNYEDEHGDYPRYAPLITAQQDNAASWAFPLCEVYKYLGFSNHIIPGTKNFWSAEGYTFANDIDVFKIYCPDTVHPHSDVSGYTNNVYAGILAEFIKTCR